MVVGRVVLKLSFWFITLLMALFLYLTFGIILDNSRAIQRIQMDVQDIAIEVFRQDKCVANSTAKQIDKVLKNSLLNVIEDLQALKIRLEKKCCIQSIATSGMYDSRLNYASEDLGAKIEQICAEPIDGTNIFKRLFGLEYSSNQPRNMLNSNMSPGNCFGFRGTKAEVIVKLGRPIYVDTIEIQHIPKKLSPNGDTSSAPKVFEVFGKESLSKSSVLLGLFVYNNSQDSLRQAFEVCSMAKYAYVQIKFQQNHGNHCYTCIYRLVVYGRMDK
ncbi:SUN domain-containing protein 2-like [Teleopsis dalmanni]|uniref:SUN domain-containing protein 2-like n=1 Tax=Teleopsis dalmanni TaxID=139649 RepID=UPI0018CFE603|nr:SUN domain-containing protein 2-like [Teleopsis dalmanni]